MDLLGSTESVLGLGDKEEGLKAHKEREMRGENFDSQQQVEQADLNT